MTTRRKTIISTLKTNLAANAANFTASNISTSRVRRLADSNLPHCAVFALRETIDTRTMGMGAASQERTLTVLIEVTEKDDSPTVGVYDLLDDYAADLEGAISDSYAAMVAVGAEAFDLIDVDFTLSEPGAQQDYGLVRLTVQIHYNEPANQHA